MVIVSRGINSLDDSFYVIFKWNRGCWNSLDWVDQTGFDRDDGESLGCGGFECDRVILRFECSAGEGENRGNLSANAMTEGLESSLEPLGDRERPNYQVEHERHNRDGRY